MIIMTRLTALLLLLRQSAALTGKYAHAHAQPAGRVFHGFFYICTHAQYCLPVLVLLFLLLLFAGLARLLG
jgi:hypothetical protein